MAARTARQTRRPPRPPSHPPFPLPLPFPLPPLTLPLSEVQCRCGGKSPAVSSPLVGAAWPKRQSHPGVVSAGCGRPARLTRPCGGLPAANRPATCRPPPPYLAPRRPQSRLWGPRGGAGLRHPPGLCVSSTSGRCLGVEFLLSLSGEMSVCGERGRV